MENMLIICQTPYQIIVASKIITSLYRNKEVDIIVTDTINDGDKLIKGLRHSSIFRNVYYLKTKQIDVNKYFNPVLNYLNKLKEVHFKIKPFLKEHKYNKLLFANIDITIQHIANYLSKFNDFEMILYEDGLSSYRKSFGDFFSNYNVRLGKKNKMKYNLLRSQFSKIDKFYIFNPKYLEWNPKFTVQKIPAINKEDRWLIGQLNKVFKYDSLEKEYKNKYIFFEESYFADKYKVNDLELVNEISNIVGKKNLMIKIHPRNPINRFKEYGYITNEITTIPWEIIALNLHLEDKVLITIASGSVLHPLIIMGIDIKAIMLFKLKELDTQLLEDLIDIIEDICVKNPANYLIPENYSELHTYLQEL